MSFFFKEVDGKMWERQRQRDRGRMIYSGRERKRERMGQRDEEEYQKGNYISK